MKKFYALALAASVVLSASAARQQKSTDININRAQVANVQTVAKEMKSTSVVKKAPKKVLAQDVEGEYEYTFYMALQGYNGQQLASAYIELDDVATGSVTITIDEYFEIEGTFDAATGTLSIPNNQYLFTDEDGKVYFYLKDFDEDEEDIVDGASDELAAEAVYENGVFTFPTYQFWAIGDPEAENLGFYWLSYVNEFEKEIEWKSCGNGQWTENIVYYTFTKEENTNAATVAVSQNPDNENEYKIADAFGDLYKALEKTTASPEMIFDITDPDNVLISLQSTGITASSGGTNLGTLYYFNEGWYCDNFGDELDEDLACTLEVGDDNVATLTIPYQACTLYSATTSQFFMGSAYASTLKFTLSSGVSNVELDNSSNAPVEYFNLQGVRVNDTVPGNLYIRRQGSDVQKIVVK